MAKRMKLADRMQQEREEFIQQGSLKQKKKRSKPASKQERIPITHRIDEDVYKALLRASADRKAQKKEPYHQQDIITDALKMWLKKNGYASA